MAGVADTKSVKITEGEETIIEFEKEQANTKSGDIYSTPGIDSPPLEDDKILLVQVPGSENYVAIGNLLIGRGAEAGETIVYSRDSSGAIQGKMYIQKDGTITFNGGEDFAVAFNGILGELQKFQTAYNPHTHTDPISGNTGPPSTSFNIVGDNFKIPEIKLPAGGVS